MNKNASQTLIENNWSSMPDGSWEKMVNGITYLIEEIDGYWYIYHSTGLEQIDAAKKVEDAISIVNKREGVEWGWSR